MNGTFLQVPDIANTEVSLCVSFTSSTSNDRIIVLVHHINDTEKLSAYLLNTTNCTTAPAPGDYVVGIFIQSDDSTLKVPATPPTISVGTVPISEYYYMIFKAGILQVKSSKVYSRDLGSSHHSVIQLNMFSTKFNT